MIRSPLTARPQFTLFLFALIALFATLPARAQTPALPDPISVAGQSGIPAFLKVNAQTVADAQSLHVNQLQTTATDFIDHDFTFDVLCVFPEKDTGDLLIGIGENGRDRILRAANSVFLHINGPADARTAALEISGKPAVPIGKLLTASAIRLEKKGPLLTASIGSLKDGTFNPDAAKSIPDLSTAAPFLDKRNSPLFIDGGTVKALRILVDGKPLDPGIRAVAAAVADDTLMFSVKGTAGLPACLKANSGVLADAEGLTGGELRTRDTNLIDHDFTFDVLFHFRGEQDASFIIGLGEDGPGNVPWTRENSVFASVQGPKDYNATIRLSGQPDIDLGHFYKPGPNLVRVEKRGDTLLFAICADYAGKFEPTVLKIIPALKAHAPFLNKLNSNLFLSGDGIYDSFRLVIDGKLVSATPAATASPTTIIAEPKADENFFPLAGESGLPGYLKPVGTPSADAVGLRGQVRTLPTDLIEHDFTFDVIFNTRDDEHQTATIGIGDIGRDRNDNNAVFARIQVAGDGGNVTMQVSRQADTALGRYVKPGRHLFRLQKRGDALTMALCVDYAGKFEPTFSRTFPDVRAIAPFLTRLNSALFIDSPIPIESVRFIVDGKPVSTAIIRVVATAPQTIPASVPASSTKAMPATARASSPASAPSAPALPPAETVSPHQFTITLVIGAAALLILCLLILWQHLRLQKLTREHAADFSRLQKQNQTEIEEIKQLLKK